MARPPRLPFEQSWRERLGWRLRWARARRLGVAERDARNLATLRRDLAGRQVQVGVIGQPMSELVFDGDERVRLGWCHRPTLRHLRDAAASGDARLVRADHSGAVWALYVATRSGIVPLLTTELRIRPGHGGTTTPSPVPTLSV